jgi:phospholipase D1/2
MVGPGAHTSPLWVTTLSTFSPPTGGNSIKYFTTGGDYFVDLIQAVDQAEKDVYIAGWQVNWDAQLKRGLRLYDLIYRNAARGINFYVMPWNDTKPVQTYEAQTLLVLNSINDRLKTEKVPPT